ncbi:MAG: peptidase [Thermoleophilia bacterium]|jgi:Xaa-Pro aminopeptidase|nr:peptidase [Thermoleophilia bacterium]
MNPTATQQQSEVTRERLARTRRAIAENGWNGLVVLDGADVRWLTGLQSSNAAVVLTADRAVVATDFRYVAEAQARGLEVAKIEQSMWADLGKVAGELAGGGALAYPPSGLTHRAFLQFTDALPDNVTLRAVDGVVQGLRMRKDADEIAAITRAAALLDGAYELVASIGLAGRTEGDVAWQIERHLREAGATALSFESIVGGGGNGAFPHHSPGSDVIPDDTLVTVDIGCILDGYCSDCTRTFAVGDPSPELRDIYDITLRAQEASLAAVLPGASGRDIDAIARDIIADAGHAEHFGHGLGHGVGIEVHEGPRLSRTSDDTLAPGMVVTVEPGIYVPGLGGVRIEDLVVVTDDGHDVLTGYTKALVSA